MTTPPAPHAAAATPDLSFAAGCTFSRATDGKVSFVWNNGNALQAVRGASVDYIDPKFHMAVSYVQNVPSYEPAKDLGRLITSGVSAKLAMIIVGMRKVMLSFENIQLNAAELHTVAANDPDGVVPEADWAVLTRNKDSYHAVIDASVTILGLNAISVLLKGHHYLSEDTMWTRLNSALDLEDHFTRLAIPAYDGPVFHDALHPVALDWKVRQVSETPSPLLGKVNGVLLKRLPGIPAGTAIVHVTAAAIRDLNVARPATREVTRGVLESLEHLIAEIQSEPLEWCAMFQRASTQANLAQVQHVEPLAALIHGAYSVVFTRRASILKSKAFGNNASRHPAMTEMGRAWGESLGEGEFSAETIADLFRSLENNIDRAAELEGTGTMPAGGNA